MLSAARGRIVASLTPRLAVTRRAGYSSTSSRLSENPNPANVPPEPPKPNVSESNATPVQDPSAFNVPLQESPEAAEKVRRLQAPNRATTWASNQQPREVAMTGPRFEQTIMELQVGSRKKESLCGPLTDFIVAPTVRCH